MTQQDRTAVQYHKMTETPIPRLILSLAAPTILSMLITSIYNLADTFLGASPPALPARWVSFSLMAIIQALGFMLGHGSGTIISRRLGSQDTHAATRFASTSFFTALAFGVVLAVVGLATLPDFMMLLGSTETILPHACAYARPILLAAPLMISSLVMNNILRYEGKGEPCHGRAGHRRTAEHCTGPAVHVRFRAGHCRCRYRHCPSARPSALAFCCICSCGAKRSASSGFLPSPGSRASFCRSLQAARPAFGRQGLNSIGGMLLVLPPAATAMPPWRA